ncbi:hypothetical protein SAMN06264364_13842 [Quadrisphaera granulorum]|uniref:Homeodomain-like domain-containing protein n=1 Tax=Quadrisphaera granulorum TaxID=317664 RepID=A0A315ZQL3_9ACTN|nr:hypothetical protein [Quadrisphaera granulorum]PWJ47393.1 hypothetical protein BXY45_13842 [Quadrisphaera granulorum]SZE98840.1 hypothetical protein SAMN06264364_13842 [Quadrisphaera granulorum]
MSDVRDLLAEASARLAETDAVRSQRLAERDALIERARAEQVPWVEIEALTGLTRGAVAKALRRAAGAGSSD